MRLVPPSVQTNLKSFLNMPKVQELLKYNEVAANLDQNPLVQEHCGKIMPTILASISHMCLAMQLSCTCTCRCYNFLHLPFSQLKWIQVVLSICICLTFDFTSILSLLDVGNTSCEVGFETEPAIHSQGLVFVHIADSATDTSCQRNQAHVFMHVDFYHH